MLRSLRLRTLGLFWALAAFTCGLVSAWLWFGSILSWQTHLTHAYEAGFGIYETLRTGVEPPAGVTISPLDQDDSALADLGQFARLSDASQPALVTLASIFDTSGDALSGREVTLAIVSDKLRYNIADIDAPTTATAPQKMANITRLLATYCSEPVVYAHSDVGPWLQIRGNTVWGCNASPIDLRLVSVVVAFLGLAILYTLVADTSARFGRFAQELHDRRRLGGPQSYQVDGPQELREIVDAVNAYLAREREQLEHRAVVLSGVSHDLGTPATRLRLRTALIEDDDLRTRIDADIDRMTGMIESVLTYTRSEMTTEEPRKLSLSSLVESIVDDYTDMGQPVDLVARPPTVMEGGRSVFMSRQSLTHLPEHQKILAIARPVSLQRAVSNLIDNALKYGRRAHVSIYADSLFATILVEDEGSFGPDDIAALTEPFKRGDNVGSVNGYGLGLTIVQAVAEQHGGTLDFERGDHGLRARLTICRN